ncbi:hypothetical protein [Pseudoflavonifractor sp. MCC625]|uniref:hypothetical protein n=1 Tax=Pseudoflavonifractor sp. MCC625 TaxID=2592647 RepID=UPI001C0091E0|nr:hypothetical protein [Pseudoflavonifractor sp. MCC625]MBT9684236.1 hypothetical protein [Pseudoflavonifractor sp. MCC625]
MKKRNIALAALLVLGSAVLAASMVLVVVPQMKSGTATDVSERIQVIQEEIQQRIDEYKVDDVAQDSIVKESLDQTKEIVEEAQEIAGLK